ncbi:KRAB-A domain-containing protein 2 [Phaenicophaeus curvirostris]|uniref:KRAB-A domain-containing protein 2 n=1 Tax=Phaenicophaeus curvirostris TaxID=33595 RepID=UPI0037F0AD8D
MHPMGALQPGLPSPMAIPPNYQKIIIDLKDCFYTILLDPDDRQRFAFSVPSVNYSEPMDRYQWKVLPQGMANSPTLCQKFVNKSLEQTRLCFPTLICIHYMDDILLAAESVELLTAAYSHMEQQLERNGLKIAQDKIQRTFPFKYLGFQLYPKYFAPQKIALSVQQLTTLNDFQKLLGDINWIRPFLKLTTSDLSPLFKILEGNPDPNSPRGFTEEASQALTKVEKAMTDTRLNYADINKPWELIILPTKLSPTGVLYQDGILCWIHGRHGQNVVLKSYPHKVAECVQQGRKLSITYLGKEPVKIILPYKPDQITWLLNMTDDFALSLANFPGEISNKYPLNKLLSFATYHSIVFPKIVKQAPLQDALTVYTDGSSNGRAVLLSPPDHFVWILQDVSAQMAELYAVYQALLKYAQPLNIITDSLYIVQALCMLETVPMIHSKVTFIQQHLSLIQSLLLQRDCPVFVGHIRSHSNLPGPMAQGNQLADDLTKPQIYNICKAKQLHELHHLSARTLRKMCNITREQARLIVKDCSSCAPLLPAPHYGVNPRGLLPNDLWQIDVTHIPAFGKLSYVHVTIDTFSHFSVASALSGEKLLHVCTHLLHCFSVMGIPKTIKTDNGPAYISQGFKTFCQQFSIQHKIGIPYNPQGQGIVEKYNHLLKTQINKLKRGTWGIKDTPFSLLSHALFVLNFLTLDEDGQSAADRHWDYKNNNKPEIYWKDPMDGKIRGPDPVLIWGRGYVCVFPTDETSPRWIPERCVRHAKNKNGKAAETNEKTVVEQRLGDEDPVGSNAAEHPMADTTQM